MIPYVEPITTRQLTMVLRQMINTTKSVYDGLPGDEMSVRNLRQYYMGCLHALEYLDDLDVPADVWRQTHEDLRSATRSDDVHEAIERFIERRLAIYIREHNEE